MKQVGILALQGDFAAHANTIEKAGAKTILVSNEHQLGIVDGLIIPGGESTTLLKLLEYEKLTAPLLAFGKKKPIFGTCAGAILMAKEVFQPAQYSFEWMDIQVERNSYGRQIDSHIVNLTPESRFQSETNLLSIEGVFIRAPRILKVGKDVRILINYQNYPVLVEQGIHLAATFHPELTSSTAIHTYFLKKIMENV